MAEMTTVKCWKCRGSGNYAIGTCWGCNGSGTNTYTTAALNRRQAAALSRRTANERKNEQRAHEKNLWIIEQTEEALIEWTREVSTFNADGTIEAWILNEEGLPNGETHTLTVEELAAQWREQARTRVAIYNH